MNYSKYSYISTYFQDYTLVFDFNKYSFASEWVKALKLKIFGGGDTTRIYTITLSYWRSSFFLMQPDSRGYITVLTTGPCVEGNFNEVIISKRLILRFIRIPSLLDVIKYHDLYKQSEPMSLYIWGYMGSEDISETLGILTSNPTTPNFSKYAVFLKNLDGS